MNPAFAKTWNAATTVNMPGISPLTYGSEPSVTVSGNTGTVNDFCPNGGQSVRTTGSGNSASWSDSMACAPILLPGQNCNITLTFTSGSLTLSLDGQALTGTGTGTVTGCNMSTVTFSMTLSAVPKRP